MVSTMACKFPMRITTIAMATLISVAFCAPAVAADGCPPLTRIVSVDLTPGEEKRSELVPVTIQGVQKFMLLDTGAAWTTITREAVDELKLPHRRGPFQLFDVSGNSSDQYATASFALGLLKADAFDFVIAPGVNIFDGDSRIVGLLGANTLKHYDLDIDFGANTLGLMSPDHCDGRVIYWHPSVVAVVPMQLAEWDHIVVPVTIDGHSINAILDTGASQTTLALPVAENIFGLKLGSPDTPRSGALQGSPGSVTYRHTFASVGFEGVAVTDLEVEIIPDKLHGVTSNAATPHTGSHLPPRAAKLETAPMLLGMNILRHFHLYIAYKEHKLYVTPAELPETAPPVAK